MGLRKKIFTFTIPKTNDYYFKTPVMSATINNKKEKLKVLLKSNIVKAWYQLDPKSYESWLEGRKASKSELNY